MAYRFTAIIIVLLLVFIPIRWSQGETHSLLINTAALAVMVAVNLMLLINKRKAAKSLFVAASFVLVIISVYIVGARQMSWLYPATAMMFFTMSPRKALLITTLLVTITSIVIAQKLTLCLWLQYTASAQCTILVVYTFCSKIRQQLKELEKLNFEASIDPLSKLGNRRSFDMRFEEISKMNMNYASPYFLILIDIDNFKAVNDRHGHDIGDQVIKHLANTITTHATSLDASFRIGGEEFALILKCTKASAREFAENLRKTIENSSSSSNAGNTIKLNSNINYTISIGASAFINDTSEWFKSADNALYKAKGQGRNQVVFS